MKKTLLAVAISALSANAFAVVDLNAGTGTPNFASEIDVDTTSGTDLNNTPNVMDAQVEIGFSVAAGTSRFVRFDLDQGAKFGANVALSGTNVSPTQSAGGTGESFVIIEITGDNTGPVDLAANVTLLLEADAYKVFNDSDVTLTYSLYETAAAAVNQTTSSRLATANEKLVNYTTGLDVSATAGSPFKIDVGSESKQFINNATPAVNVNATDLATITVDVETGVLWNDDGLQVALTDIVDTGTKLVVSGDITAGKKSGDDLANDVLVLGAANTDARSNSSADFNVNTGSVSADTLTYNVDGTTAIADGTFTALYDVTAASGSDVSDISLGTISTLTKNGASVDLDFALTPTGAFSNYVRVTNKTNLAGRVFITAYNDQGDSVTIDLGDVSGQTTVLGAQASTSLMTIDAIYAAAQAKDSSFAVGTPANKLRLKIEGEFATIAAQSLTVSTDGTTFSTF